MGEVETFAASTPSWPARPTPPATPAPNVLIILVDDLGYSDVGSYGSEIATPHIDRLAAEGVRYTNFHVNPMCSPTRASLLTGLNAHDAGMGWVAESDPGYPGYASELTQNAATLAELFRDNGYSTLMTGKWHLCKPQDKSPAGDKNSWPVQRGFDEFYGILNGFTNFHHPDRLIDGNSVVAIDQYPDGYYLTDDLTDRAIQMVRGTKSANPARPFFLYMAHPAVHAPLQAKTADIAAQHGRYDSGWDAVRAARFARQKDLGILPNAALAARNHELDHDVEAWDSLAADDQRLYARLMEVYAAMVSNVDENIGRLLSAIDQLGELDNTIVVFTSDNGASREGEATGSSQYFEILPPALASNRDRDLAALDLIGGPRTLPHYPRGWAMACNTPFRMYKTNTHAGGHQVPFIVRWPEAVADGGSIRDQYAHITDVLPTLLQLTGIERPDERNGRHMKPLAGTSLVDSLASPAAPGPHPEQYYENQGHRAMYRDGWEAVTLHAPRTNFHDERWELFDLAADPSQTTDQAGAKPKKLAELQAAWHDAAERYDVFPLDEGSWVKMIERPPWLDDFSEPVTIFPGTPSLEHWRAGRLVQSRPFTITISLDFAPGDQGILVAHGDQGGGYSAWIENDRLVVALNEFGTMHHIDAGVVAAGTQQVRIEAHTEPDRLFRIEVSIDGEPVGAAGGFRQYIGIAPFQGIDVGIDRRSPVCWDIHERHGTFPYTGTLHWARWEPGPLPPDAGANLLGMLREMGAKYD